MKRMVLTRLILSGSGKKDAVLNFKRGLNVISGDSDTGKTYAFQCLNYILGAQNPPKNIVEATGYSLVSLEFEIDDNIYKLDRIIGSTKVTVTANGVEKTLACKHDPTSLNNLSRYLLSLLLEHNENVLLKRNSLNNKRTLSLRDIIHLCTVAETDIIAESSAFQSIQYTEKTARKSALKYVITGIDDSDTSEQDDSENENIRRAGVVQFLTKKKAALQKQIEEIEQDKNYKLYLGNSTVPEMIKTIKELRDLIFKHQSEITSNLKQIKGKKEFCFDCEVRISEFEKLRFHYSEELKKSGMVSTHADFLTQLPHLACPVCSQTFKSSIITPENEEELFNYFVQTNVQLKKKIEDLDASIRDISTQIETISSEITQLEERNTQLYEAINQKQSSLDRISKNIAIVRQLDTMKNTIEIYRQELISVEGDIVAYSEKVKKITLPPTAQGTAQYDTYCSSIETVLKSWGFSDGVSISFDESTLDLSIDGKSRSSWGKGYRAFIMSAMVIGLMRYCYENNRLHPGFVIIDSPLVSLKERKIMADEWIDDYMEKKMIEDILAQDSFRQVIIFENKNLKYDFDYNYIEFCHEGDIRKGFIP